MRDATASLPVHRERLPIGDEPIQFAEQRHHQRVLEGRVPLRAQLAELERARVEAHEGQRHVVVVVTEPLTAHPTPALLFRHSPV